MPTLRQRHMITESPAIELAIDRAARLWPELKDDRAELLRRIIERGNAQVEAELTSKVAAKQAAILEVAGSMTGMWPENYLEELRAEWPA